MRIRALLFFASALGLLPGCSRAVHSSGDPEEKAAEPVTVEAAPVRTASFQRTVRGVGLVTATPGGLTRVSAAVEGRVAEILVAEGDAAKAGQPLIRLDDRLARDELEGQRAARAELAASLQLLKAGARPEERRAAELDVERAQVAVDVARAVFERLQPLQAKREISDQELFVQKKRLEEAELALKAAQAHRDLVLAAPRAEAVAELEAKIARAEAGARSAQTRVEYMMLTADRAGVVNTISCHPGQFLKAGDIAADVLDISEVLVVVGISARDVGGIQVGAEARIQPAAPGKRAGEGSSGVAGKVASVGLEAGAATGTLPVRILARNAEGRLWPGTAAVAEIVVANVPEALAVPDAAVIPSEGGPTLVVVREGKAVILRALVGAHQAGLAQVEASGLKLGELVVTLGGYNLAEKTPVHIELEKGTAEPPAKP